MNYAKVTSVKELFLTPAHVCVDKAANNGAKLFVDLGMKPSMHLVEINIFSLNHTVNIYRHSIGKNFVNLIQRLCLFSSETLPI